MIQTLLFAAFAIFLLIGAWSVVLARNPMLAVLGMIFTFLNAAGIFILMQAEFLGLLLIMVYVGAIAVMFLFVLMTIDIDFALLKEGMAPYLPTGLLVVFALGALLATAVLGNPLPASNVQSSNIGPEGTRAIGQVLFTDYALPFQAAGLILLTAMVGAIILTHRKRPGTKRQNVHAQVMRDKDACMDLTLPKLGQGATATHWAPKSVETKTKKD